MEGREEGKVSLEVGQGKRQQNGGKIKREKIAEGKEKVKRMESPMEETQKAEEKEYQKRGKGRSKGRKRRWNGTKEKRRKRSLEEGEWKRGGYRMNRRVEER